MQVAIDETGRRRLRQEEYNRRHDIEPQTILKEIHSPLVQMSELDYYTPSASVLDIAEGSDTRPLRRPDKAAREGDARRRPPIGVRGGGHVARQAPRAARAPDLHRLRPPDALPESSRSNSLPARTAGDLSVPRCGRAGALRRQGEVLAPPRCQLPRPRSRTAIAGDAGRCEDLEFVVTDTEAEALLLENNWIKQRQPRYNILLRDDKTYPYVKLTVGEDCPRVDFTRRLRDDGAEYFGPYIPAGLARKAIKVVQKMFQIRVCRIDIDGGLPRPCLYYDMRRCLGPCVDGLTTRRAYDDAVEAARLFLAGRNELLVRRLRREMQVQPPRRWNSSRRPASATRWPKWRR